MIAVIGATGFVGSAVTTALAAAGEPVRVLVRDPQRARARLGTVLDHVEVVVGDMHDPAALDRLLHGARAVYVLVQTVTAPQQPGTGDFAAAERAATARILAAMSRQGVRRLLTVGLIGARPDAPNAWVRARAELETLLLGSGRDVTVLRAGLVVGRGSVGFDGLLDAADRRVARIRGRGHQRWSFVALDDLVRYLVAALDEPRTVGHAFDVGSVEAPTYRELLRRTAELLGRPEPRVAVTPLWLLRAAAPLVERRQRLPRGGLRAAAAHLGDDLVGDPVPIRAVLPLGLTSWDDAVRAAVPAGPGRDRRAAGLQPALEQDHVAPPAGQRAVAHPAEALAGADHPEPGGGVQREARSVLGEDPGLHRPDAAGPGGGQQGLKQRPPDATSARLGVDVDGVLDDTGVDASAGDGARCHPAEHGALGAERDEAVVGQVVGVELGPGGRGVLEGGVAGGDAGGVDFEHRVGVAGVHGRDRRGPDVVGHASVLMRPSAP